MTFLFRKILVNCFFLIGLITQLPAQSYFPEKQNTKIKVAEKIPVKAYAFPFAAVRLVGDSPFQAASYRNRAYLDSLQPDRLLHRFRLYAGLTPKAPLYEGWENLGVSGHTLGHYLSAISLTYATTGEKRYRERAAYIVEELSLCQRSRKDGYVGGIPEQDRIFDEVASGKIRSKGFDLNGGWVPWYTVHKLLAGLTDAYLYTDNAKALTVATKLADWAVVKFSKLSDAQFQQMLNAEHGGMMEILTNLYALTGKTEYLQLANRFYHRHTLDPFEKGIDELDGIHANTQVPKVLGSARQYELTGNPARKKVVDFYWNTMLNHHSYVIGGQSEHELFHKPDAIAEHLGTTAAEVCHTYNMLKITRHLFQWEPAERYMDYYERALYNHILASQDPEKGMFSYFVSMKPGHFKTYSTPYNSFWCCVASGMENHSRYTESIYYHDSKGIFVNLFIPSEVKWADKGFTLTQQTRFPEDSVITFTVGTAKPQQLALYLRYPKWAASGVKVSVNGKPFSFDGQPGSYITLERRWKQGDIVNMIVPMNLRTEPVADNPSVQAILYGPLVLAGELGKAEMASPAPYAAGESDYIYQPVPENTVPDLITNGQPVTAWLKPEPAALAFRTVNVGVPSNPRLVPFYKIYDQRYTVYWNVFDQQTYAAEKGQREAEYQRQRAEELRTNDILRIGEMQPERDHNLQGENTTSGTHVGKKWRLAEKGGWFSFEMKINGNLPQEIVATYWGSDDYNRTFDILVDGEKVATQSLTARYPQKFFDEIYKIPTSLTKGKPKITVKFQAHPGNIAGGLYGCRVRNQ